jgi:hypothetical protein
MEAGMTRSVANARSTALEHIRAEGSVQAVDDESADSDWVSLGLGQGRLSR